MWPHRLRQTPPHRVSRSSEAPANGSFRPRARASGNGTCKSHCCRLTHHALFRFVDADSVASRHPPKIHQSGVLITTINAMTHSISGFPLWTKKVLRLPEAGGHHGQPERVWISARGLIKTRRFCGFGCCGVCSILTTAAIGSAGTKFRPIRRYGRRTHRSWGYSLPVAASFSRYPDRQAHRAARVFCGRSRPRLAVALLRESGAALQISKRMVLNFLA